MVKVALEFDADGCLRGFTAGGHADGPPGANVACAAVTVLLRTSARAVAARGLAEGGSAEEPGDMHLAVGPVPASKREWLRGVSDVLARGLADVSAEYPGQLEVRIVDAKR